MEVHVTPETATKLDDLAATSGRVTPNDGKDAFRRLCEKSDRRPL